MEAREEFILDGIAAHVMDHSMKDLKLEILAKMACMNRFKLSRLFKNRFGQTFTSYLNSIRINNAVELFKNPDINITEVAYFVGYRSVRHFNRIFKAVHKISPREYRKNKVYYKNNKSGELNAGKIENRFLNKKR